MSPNARNPTEPSSNPTDNCPQTTAPRQLPHGQLPPKPLDSPRPNQRQDPTSDPPTDQAETLTPGLMVAASVTLRTNEALTAIGLSETT